MERRWVRSAAPRQTGGKADGAYKGVFIAVNGVAGSITVKPYVKLAVTTAHGDGIILAYGNPVTA